MAKLNVNIGQSVNDKTGDTLRSAFDKINQNFTELYALGSGGAGDWTWPLLNNHYTRANLGGSQGSYIEGQSPGGLIAYNDDQVTMTAGSQSVYLNSNGILTLTGGMNISQSIAWPGGSAVFEDSGLVLQGATGLAITSPGTTQITAGSAQWTFGADGTLNLPDSISAGNAIIQTTSPINIQVNSNAQVWTFGTDGVLTLPDGGTIADSNSYLTTLNLYVQGSLKGVDGSTGTTGQILTRQSNGGVAWANLAALPYVKSTFTGGTATLGIFTATWVNSVAIRLQISVSNTVNVTLQYTATSIIAGTTTSTNGGGMWTQPPSGAPFSSNNLDNLGDIQVMYLQDITNQKIYRITGMNTAGNVNPAQGSVLIEQLQ